MPDHIGKDKIGCFHQWGNHGTRYYFKPNNPISEGIAKYKAKKQGRAIHTNKNR